MKYIKALLLLVIFIFPAILSAKDLQRLNVWGKIERNNTEYKFNSEGY